MRRAIKVALKIKKFRPALFPLDENRTVFLSKSRSLFF